MDTMFQKNMVSREHGVHDIFLCFIFTTKTFNSLLNACMSDCLTSDIVFFKPSADHVSLSI